MQNHFVSQLPCDEPILDVEEPNENNPDAVWPIKFYFFEIIE